MTALLRGRCLLILLERWIQNQANVVLRLAFIDVDIWYESWLKKRVGCWPVGYVRCLLLVERLGVQDVLVELGTKSSKEEKLLDLNFKVKREVVSNKEAMRTENENLKKLIDELRYNQKKDKEEIKNLKKEVQVLDEENTRLKEEKSELFNDTFIDNEKQLEIVRYDDSAVQTEEENEISKRGLETKKNEEIGSLVKRVKKRTMLEERRKNLRAVITRAPKRGERQRKKKVDAKPITVDYWPTPIVDPITIAWEDEWKELTLSAAMVMDLMLGRFIDSQTYVRDNLTASVESHLISEIESLGDDVILCFFPMIHGKYKNDKVGNHWTLLVYNIISDKWAHYNSIFPRNTEDICLQDAEQLQIHVTQAINDKRRMECSTLINPNPTVKSAICTQQDLELADYALYVCLFMETLAAKGQMPLAVEKEAMHRDWASKAYKILSDKPC
ncbi:hypothetical protein IFM89_008252 [Coptis chinensis]|uniref:Ubiquitin-like protease family profile domain-containing protein n=1 Tax=Coptis chinensis TaxID=261450 RepID=A0A835IBQ4_9MAGN|nr:hypothetical protein IFM89_008252 [Coptis chinensis]